MFVALRRYPLPEIVFAIILSSSLTASGSQPPGDPSNSAPPVGPSRGSSVPTAGFIIGIPDLGHFRKAAEKGDPVAQVQLGYLYATGTGVPASASTAMHWYQLAASSGYARAKVNMGVMYARGVTVRRDEALAMQLFREAADKGDGLGASYLGYMYLLGLGVKPNISMAERWFEKGEKLHDPVAAYNLGQLASGSYGHPRDLKKSINMLKKAADAGYIPAIHSLGLLYANNPGLAESPSEILDLLTTASSSGWWRSSVAVAILNRDGRFTPQDLSEAYYYFRLATLQGGDQPYRLVANDLRILEAKLGAKETGELSERAGAWHRAHPDVLAFLPEKRDPFRVIFGPGITEEMQEPLTGGAVSTRSE